MEFQLTKLQKLIRKATRELTEKEFKPIAQEIDETGNFPKENVEKLKKYNLLGMNIPKEYGGAGADDLSYVIAVEEISRYCATTGVILSAHNSLACWPIYYYGNDYQKEKFLVPLAKGEKLGAFALTEPNAGSDAGNQSTTAIKDGNKWIINGTKIFITNGGAADIYIVFASTKKELGAKGISAFIIERNTPGFKIGKIENKMGIRGSATAELIFDNVIIPEENLLGKENKGFKIALKTLDGGRIGIAAQALGIAQGAFDETIKYIKQREQFGRPIAKFQSIQFTIAEMKTKLEAARTLVYNAALKKMNYHDYSLEAAMAKYYASDIAMEITRKAVQLHGGYGYTKEYDVERMMRDAKITEIYEGTTEIQKMVIAANILK
ncbi:butyryl-CoA dehydrogenase [Marinitoga hydrogenitolerans DSM 16785]|uniref:Butyryl-CoA dehydrogenase n=1 Tax=Marinitoga hydrogenitolerans (strain DSM 16785 / JCM 12826 / AT1271) TaxID=1122195 RepID=A0A1M4XGX2_MARH1|nr:acyl-CoA dehydrogenase [Marinitoga hydrogenitolerans]SHE92641.1 butyryl-CoA dehydrogenase [Marinitoga hydrogenitolerans DSM 16785]